MRAMPLNAQNIAVVGAGIGGLSAALELSHLGANVTVIESATGPGGKMRTLPTEAGPVDAGPTVFTMGWIFDELFAAVGERFQDHVTLKPLDVLARHHWRNAPTLDLFADPDASRDAIGRFAGQRAVREFDSFSARARRLFDALYIPVMCAANPTPFSVARASLGNGPSLLRDLAPLKSFGALLDSSFTDPRLAQLFGRYATYVGGSPYLSPAVLALIWHAEASGVARIEGGMASLVRCLERLCRARGVQFRYETTVQQIVVRDGKTSGVALSGGDAIECPTVLFNGDPAALASGLLGPGPQKAAPARPRGRRSLSAWVWTFAAEVGHAPLEHHNVVFGDNSQAEFDDLFRVGRKPQDPTLYVCAQDRSAAAVRGPERFQIIMNAPADGDICTPTEQEIRQCEARVFQRLTEAGLPLNPPVAENALTTPWDFAQLFPGTGGALYGTNPHSLMSTFHRPRARSEVPGLYLAGGGIHPGPGVPMATLSGRLAAAAIRADLASTSRSRRTAMPGGTSTGSRMTAPAVSRSSGS
ncbi:MAG: 1-hydroxycarotenoid 3,4-desaturase CrtD [Pseudomonadota bacterium]